MPASDAHAATDGERLLGGRYRLRRYIAKGGMAEVWEGYDEILSRPVAVKVLLPHLATDETVLERFRREAVTAARLAHPGVVATYDTGADSGTAWIVMELVRGRTLRHLMSERGVLDPALAVSIAGQVTDALAHAHRAGLVHRDVKPANVLICDDEGLYPRAKVTDFGIAKATEGLGLDLTRTGIVLGTPKYLSPEQVEGIEPDARADLYSLGVVLFEMLAGKAPFVGPTDMATALSHLRDEPPSLRELRPGTPPELVGIVGGLLVKNRDERTASAAVLRRELATAARHLGTGRRREESTPSTPTSVIAGGVGGAGPGLPGTAPGRPPTDNRAWEQTRADRNGSGPGSPIPVPGQSSTTWGTNPAPTPRPPSPSDWGAAVPSGTTHSGAGAGVTQKAPSAWAPPPGPRSTGATRIADPPPGSDRPGPRPERPQARRGRRGPGILVAVLVVVGVIVAAVLFGEARTNHSGNGSGIPVASGPIAISGASEYVLNGHSPDNAGDLPYLYDGNPSTIWSTDLYHSPTFGGYYSGLGVVLELNGNHKVSKLTVTSPSTGWSAQAYVTVSEPPAGNSVAGWGAPTGSASGISGPTTLNLGGHVGRYVMLWITNLGPADRVAISDVSIQ